MAYEIHQNSPSDGTVRGASGCISSVIDHDSGNALPIGRSPGINLPGTPPDRILPQSLHLRNPE